MITAGVVNVIYGVLLIAWFFTGQSDSNGVDAVAGAVFVILAANAMAFFYFQFINLALTSIHMSVLFRVYWTGKLSQDVLVSQYNDQLMIAERLRRLVQLKQIELRDGMAHLRSHAMVCLTTPVFLWRRVLGWPC